MFEKLRQTDFFQSFTFCGYSRKDEKAGWWQQSFKCSSFVCASSIFLLLHNAAFAQDFIQWKIHICSKKHSGWIVQTKTAYDLLLLCSEAWIINRGWSWNTSNTRVLLVYNHSVVHSQQIRTCFIISFFTLNWLLLKALNSLILVLIAINDWKNKSYIIKNNDNILLDDLLKNFILVQNFSPSKK